MGTNRSRIVFLHYTAPPIVGGVEAVIEQHLGLFAAAGYETAVIAGRGGTDLPASVEFTIIPEVDSEYPQNLAVQKVLEEGTVTSGFRTLQDHILAALRPVLRESDVLIVHNVMTMHFNLALTAALYRMAQNREMRHFVVWCHDVSRYANPASGAVQRTGFPWDFLRTARPENAYVAVSSQRQRLLAKVLDIPKERIQVIPNGVDPAALLGLSSMGEHLAHEFGLFSAELVILMPIRITRAKNISFAIRVAAALKQAGLSLRLVVTGPPDPHVPDIQAHFAELKELRKTLSVEKEVVFVYDGTGEFPPPLHLEMGDVSDLYRICDLVLMPSLSEGFGMPVLEAAMADKPVFATDMPILEDLGTGFDYRIEAGESPESVAERIREWAASDAAHRLRRRVRTGFSWPSIFERQIEPLIARVAVSKAEG